MIKLLFLFFFSFGQIFALTDTSAISPDPWAKVGNVPADFFKEIVADEVRWQAEQQERSWQKEQERQRQEEENARRAEEERSYQQYLLNQQANQAAPPVTSDPIYGDGIFPPDPYLFPSDSKAYFYGDLPTTQSLEDQAGLGGVNSLAGEPDAAIAELEESLPDDKDDEEDGDDEPPVVPAPPPAASGGVNIFDKFGVLIVSGGGVAVASAGKAAKTLYDVVSNDKFQQAAATEAVAFQAEKRLGSDAGRFARRVGYSDDPDAVLQSQMDRYERGYNQRIGYMNDYVDSYQPLQKNSGGRRPSTPRLR